MAEFVMPSLGSDMEAGTLVAWLKKPGDRVQRGDIIAEVDTDKGVIEVEVFTSGTIERLLVPEGTKVPVSTPLALIRDEIADAQGPPERAPEIPPPPPSAAVAPAEAAPASAGSLHTSSTLNAPRVKISPSARRLARELGVNADLVRGTGPGGAITREDIERSAVRPPAPAPAAPVEQKQRMRQAIAAAMARSNREIPHYYVSHTVDVEPALLHLERLNAERPVPERLLPAVLWLKAIATALRDYPELNGRWENEQLVQSSAIHLGMAIALRGGGLVIPAIHHTDQLTLDQIMQKLRDLVDRSRRGQLRSSELTDGTITVTSLGERGVESVFGVIYPPQVALVGLGALCMRPWVVDGRIIPRRLMQVSLAADHRASDGHRGSLFVDAVDQLLKEPERL